MRQVIKDNQVAVYDETLPVEVAKGLWRRLQAWEYSIPHISGWKKIWRISDGLPLVGAPISNNHVDSNDVVWQAISVIGTLVSQNESIVGVRGVDWASLSFRPYLYPVGSKISWHNDQGYAGAVVYYAHEYWSMSWGGELNILDVSSTVSETAMPIEGSHLDHEAQDLELSKCGVGRFIAPVPNRLVITGPKVWHSMNRVDRNAGDHVRCTITGFLLP